MIELLKSCIYVCKCLRSSIFRLILYSRYSFTLKGKTRKFRRTRQNKYESQSKKGLQDPWDSAVLISSSVSESNANGSKANNGEEVKRLRRDEKRERGVIEYPCIEVVHDYDYGNIVSWKIYNLLVPIMFQFKSLPPPLTFI